MYEAFFHFQGRPFLAAPRVDRYVPADAFEAARQALARCIQRAEGAGLLVGPAGTGKTLLLEMLAGQFRESYAVALLSDVHLGTRRALLQAILFQLNLPYRGLDEGELRLLLLDHLGANRDGRCLLLLVDEAHTLPMRLLEEVRMITNLAHQGLPRVRLVLAGSAALEERLANPKLASLAQRITARCYLQSLAAMETDTYIRKQIAAVGGNPDAIFSDDARRAVYQATDGVPRLINQLCDHALVMAFAGGRTRLEAAGIQEAWSDLQQLPTPWNESTAREDLAAKRDSVIEFGALPADHSIDDVVLPVAESSTSSLAPLSSFIAPGMDEPRIDFDEPDEDYSPAAESSPEAELVFGPGDNPFAETFAEEEVVFDRYASADALLAARQRVRAVDGPAWATLLEPFTNAAAANAPAAGAGQIVASATPSASEPTPQRPVLRIEPKDESSDPALEVWRSKRFEPISKGRPGAGRGPVAPRRSEAPSSELAPDLGVLPVEHAQPDLPSINPSGSDEVIIIEDDPQQPKTAASTAGVRRQEYAQLFARLRDG
jgi:type II secretory pathway predicted ATPase ExeA